MSKRPPGRGQTRSARLALLCAFAPCFFGVLACGGRSVTDGSELGSSGTVGSSGSGGHLGHSEGNTAGVAGAGLPNAGQGGAMDGCANVNCPAGLCPVNTTPVPLPGEPSDCCGNVACQPVCTGACSPCGPGSHPVTDLSGCCPICEPDVHITTSCESGRMIYATLRELELDEYASGCSVDQDCVAFAPSNRCETECDSYAIVGAQLEAANTYLQKHADVVCANCPLSKQLACGQPVPGVCIEHVCRLP